ncbi:P-loop NTPase fold protein [Spirosoma sp.]|uniref:KAP family P-loop NTPase fold protein n=1 Tax=Spirosoma sp. TaxID=1899569 RepID=UPI002608EA61|nr:P-loop NTPase fold protein [Spirosoma sp.]MCX6218299.1 P-loop NTPase fold protein [Spirosoma sp.]
MKDRFWSYYWGSFRNKDIIKYSVLLTIIYIFNFPINKLIKKYIRDILFEGFDSQLFTSIMSFLLFLYSLYFFKKKFTSRRYISVTSVIFSLLCFLFYLVKYRSNILDYNFVSFFYLNNLYIIDVVFISLSIIGSKYIYIKEDSNKTNSNQYHLIEDNFEEENSDELYREPYAKEVSKIINDSKTKKVFSIAITSEWGNGKSVFIRYIVKHLNAQDSIVLFFEPWKFENVNQSLSVFLNELDKEFKKYDSEAAFLIDSYTKKLANVESAKLLSLSINELLFASGNDESKQIENINKIIDRIGKKIIIIVDDLDRLTKAELLQVFSIIRNYLDFKNVFFLSAFDKNYVNNQLAELGSGSENFINKIFQLEISLPPINKKFLKSILINHITSAHYSSVVKKQMEIAIHRIDLNLYDNNIQPVGLEDVNIYPSVSLINILFKNIRDVKRFMNSYNIAYVSIGSEIEIIDLFLLELLKYRFFYVYALLANGEIITWTKQNSLYRFDSTKLEEQLKGKEIAMQPYNIKVILKLLEVIFLDSNSERSISRPRYYHLYFNYQLLGTDSIVKYSKKIYSSKDVLKNYMIELIRNYENNLDDKSIEEYLFNIKQISYFDDSQTFENVVFSLIFLYFNLKYNELKMQVKNIIEVLGIYIPKITVYNNGIMIIDLFDEILNDEKYNSSIKLMFLCEILQSITISNDNEFLPYITSKTTRVFKEELNSFESNEVMIYLDFKLLYNKLYRSSIWSDEDVIKDYSNYLLKNYKYFLSNLFEPIKDENSVNDYYFINPIALYMFNNIDGLKTFLNKLPLDACTEFISSELNNITLGDTFHFPDFASRFPCNKY